MNRFFGKMPSDCVEKIKRFKDSNHLSVTIEAGTKGWTVIWADSSTDYRDEVDSTENNFKRAYDFAVNAVGPLW